MKRNYILRLLLFWSMALVLVLGSGCAGRKALVMDEGVKADTGKGAAAVDPVEKPEKRVVKDEKDKPEAPERSFGSLNSSLDDRKMDVSAKEPLSQEISDQTTAKIKPRTAPVRSAAESAGPLEPVGDRMKEEPAGEADRIILNFDDADLHDVVRTIADLLSINYIVDPNVLGKVTIHTADGLRKADLFSVFFQILEANSLTAVKEGDLYRIIRLKNASRMPIVSRLGVKGEEEHPGERIILQIIPLKFVSADEMTKLLAPFISEGGTIISHQGSNTLLVVDKGINVLKVLRLVKAFDINLFESLTHRFYTLKHVNVEKMVEVLKAVFPQDVTAGKSDVKSAGFNKLNTFVKFIAVSRLNTMLTISSNPGIFDKVEGFIRELDVVSEEAEPRIYIYFVKNGEAAQLAGLLGEVFGDGSSNKKSQEDGSGKPKATSANPFAKKSKTITKPKKVVVDGKSKKGPGTLREEINITSDDIRNALIIEAVPADYQIIEGILETIDVLPRQVLIEASILEVTLNDDMDLGVEWSYEKDKSVGTGLLEATLKGGEGETAGLRYAIGFSDKVKADFHAWAKDRKVNILSSPHILASDNKEAKIEVSNEIPVASSSYEYTSGDSPLISTNIQYRDTGVILTVTPHINERRLVTMDINQEVSEPTEDVEVGGQSYPSFFKRTVKTSLTVKHGQTIILGGLIRENKSDIATGVPFLVKIPLLRHLFGTESKGYEKQELIILLTPRVIVSLDDVDAVTEEFKGRLKNAVQAFE